MKNTIFGFNQEKAIEYGLDVKDLLLIDYIWDMLGSPTMQHIIRDDYVYVWLMHDRILSDLPILKISNRSLIDYLNKLKDLGLILVTTISNEKSRGSKSYYTITSKCEALRYDQAQNFAVGQRPSAENCSSDNISSISLLDNIDIENTSNNQQVLLTDNTNNINKEELEVRKREDCEWFVATYHEICQSLPKCKCLTDKRKKAIRNILKKFTKEEILEVFNNLENSDFCKGKNDRGWKADIDFILREDKFVSVLEGKYNSKRRCNVEEISEGVKFRVTAEEKEEMRKAVERGELKEY